MTFVRIRASSLWNLHFLRTLSMPLWLSRGVQSYETICMAWLRYWYLTMA
jgi:hypothetical protein